MSTGGSSVAGGSRRRRGLAVFAAASLLAAVCSGLGPARPARGVAPTTWLAGAAAETVTPPRYDATHDTRDFPLCNTGVFSGARTFDFEEPYVDQAGTGQFDYTQDLFCDANLNGRYDGIYLSGGIDHLATWVHDDAWARALAISDGTNTVVIESITSQGLMNEDIGRIRTKVKADRPGVTEIFVSSTHNESTPDPIGIYGAPDNPSGAAGAFSGIDDYYISYLVDRAAQAAEEAVDALTPARLRVGETYSSTVQARLSRTFLTTTDDGDPVATARKLRIFQAVDASSGANIETVLNWAAHNQQTGHAGDNVVATDPVSNTPQPINRAVTDDWPGVFAAALQADVGGHAMFLVADNGSIEDPHVIANPDGACPPIPPSTDPRSEGCLELPAATGALVAADVAAALNTTEEVAPHTLTATRDVFDAPLENNLFVAAFAAGLFAHRHLDPAVCGGACLKTEVGLVDFGPQLEMMVTPGESYPALVEGHPWGIEETSCPARSNPPVPAWHGRSKHKLEMGLGNDMIGYIIPAPGWYAQPAIHPDLACQGADPSADVDPRGHYHKLESESVGPTAGNLVAQHLAALADATDEPAAGEILPGRFVMADGSLTRKGADGPVGMWVVPDGTTDFAAGAGVLVGLPGVAGFGGRPVDAHGVFVDFDGLPQAGPTIDTRGMMVVGAGECAAATTGTRYYMDPYPTLTGDSPGAATTADASAACPSPSPGLPVAGPPHGLPNTSGAAGPPLSLALGLLVLAGLAVVPSVRRRRPAIRSRHGL
ncbi:MAG: hypothetical protein QOE92_1654 [Chloroflexota bacterium]|nr:hypothetical protein [Chloroflexota bacterium]